MEGRLLQLFTQLKQLQNESQKKIQVSGKEIEPMTSNQLEAVHIVSS